MMKAQQQAATAPSVDVDARPGTAVHMQWEGGFKFTAADEYGHTIVVDAPQEDGADFDGFKPGELLLTSLAGCSGIDVAIILRKQRQELTGLV